MMHNARGRNLATRAAALVGLCAPLAVAAADAPEAALLAKYNCQTCHAADRKLIGPAYKEIAVKYAGDSAASARLEQRVRNGSSGVWGTVPMPPNNVPDADLKTLVAWILTQK